MIFSAASPPLVSASEAASAICSAGCLAISEILQRRGPPPYAEAGGKTVTRATHHASLTALHRPIRRRLATTLRPPEGLGRLIGRTAADRARRSGLIGRARCHQGPQR